MDYTEFLIWLIDEKKMNQRSAKDVVSRCKRVCKIINDEKIDSNSLEKLLQNNKFKAYTMFVKSQLKRATTLFVEFKENK